MANDNGHCLGDEHTAIVGRALVEDGGEAGRLCALNLHTIAQFDSAPTSRFGMKNGFALSTPIIPLRVVDSVRLDNAAPSARMAG
jgi:hypothetical protein